MRMLLGIVVLFVVGLSGCVSQGNFDAGMEAAKGSPALREEFVAKCVERKKFAGEQRRLVAKTMNVSEASNVEKILCTRTVNGFTSGRITYKDYQNAMRGEVSPKIIRVIQGR